MTRSREPELGQMCCKKELVQINITACPHRKNSKSERVKYTTVSPTAIQQLVWTVALQYEGERGEREEGESSQR